MPGRRRLTHRLCPEQLAGNELVIDGFNILTTIEAALGGAVVIVCRDTTCRDIAGIHGGYRRVAETEPALDQLIDRADEIECSQMSLALRPTGIQ